jgi:hypothetical protein
MLLLLQILTYTEAVKTVDRDKAVGKPNSLWIAFAKFYEGHGDIDNARIIFNKAVQVRRIFNISFSTRACRVPCSIQDMHCISYHLQQGSAGVCCSLTQWLHRSRDKCVAP